MRIRLAACPVVLCFMLSNVAWGQGLGFDLLSHFWKEEHPSSYTMKQVGRMIDQAEDGIRDDGIVVIKHPDIWGQARMTRYRLDFEEQMKGDLSKFETVVSAAVNRADQASFEQSTAIGAALTPLGKPAVPGQAPVQVVTSTPDQVQTAAGTALDKAMTLLSNSASNGSLPDLESSTAFKTLVDTVKQTANSTGRPGIGLEPTIVLDEKKRYLDALNNIRRNNLGDDTADSVGFGLYLVRLPVSVQPGEETFRDHGAQVTVTVRHDFAPDFLPTTFRNLVINDLVDQLGPIVYELIRTGVADEYDHLRRTWGPSGFDEDNFVRNNYDELTRMMLKGTAIYLSTSRVGERVYPIAPTDIPLVFHRSHLLYIASAARNSIGTPRDTASLEKAGARKYRLGTAENPDLRATDVRAYLRQELEAAYDLMVGQPGAMGPLFNTQFIEERVVQPVLEREFDPNGDRARGPVTGAVQAWVRYDSHVRELGTMLPGDIRDRSLGSLCWAIAVDAGLLNRRLRTDMRRLTGVAGFTCPDEVDQYFFYTPLPLPEADELFKAYVRARWPILAFGLDPVTDQQNIADAFSRFRDLQLALAFSFSAGRVNLNQLNRFRRQLTYEASTIALNRTVTAFAYGDQTFGWRFSPRYQTPPEERSNFGVVARMLLSGGPGPDYQVKNSKLEAGQREMTAAIIMPSFLSRVRVEVSGNWYRLSDPDEVTLDTGHILEQSRRVYELRHALGCVSDAERYPPEELGRMQTKVEQLQSMLPMQTHLVNVPYGNQLGGFELFTQGASSLAPELLGYQGADYVTRDGQNGILLFGKNIALQGTLIVAGGQNVPEADAEILSREIVRLRLPRGMQETTAYDQRYFVEVHLATPNGISNRLLIPLRPEPPGTSPPQGTTSPGAMPSAVGRAGPAAPAIDPGVLRTQLPAVPSIPGVPAGLAVPAPSGLPSASALLGTAASAIPPPATPPASQGAPPTTRAPAGSSMVVVVPQTPTTIVNTPPPKHGHRSRRDATPAQPARQSILRRLLDR